MGALLIAVGLWCWSDHEKYPKPDDWSDVNKGFSYVLNNVGPFILVPGGIFAALYAVRFLRRPLVADDAGIGYRGDEQIAWADIKELDATKLPKGFLYVQYGEGNRLTLDSWKLQSFRQLVAFIDQHVPANCPKRT